MREYGRREPVIVERARGARLRGIDGRWYWDGTSSIWVSPHGHRVPALDRAVARQLGRVAHATLLGQGNVPSILLAERLARIAPRGLTRVFYSDDGSTANEAALKMAVQYWVRRGRPAKRRFLSFEGGYHGDTMGAVGTAPVRRFHKDFLPLLPPAIRAPFPVCPRGPDGLPHAPHPNRCASLHLRPVAALIRRHAGTLAGAFVEPMVQGVAGIRVMPPGFLRGFRRLCTRYGVLLIADEVAVGLGRTGRMFACDHERVRPDLMTLGKGLAGGYLPLAATLATDAIFRAFLGEPHEDRTFFHGHSFSGNPLGCAAALASLDLLRRLLPSLPGRSRLLGRSLAPLRGAPFVREVRRAGMMVGIELAADPRRGSAFRPRDRAGWIVVDRAREMGLLVRPIGDVVIFMPPLAASPRELRTMAGILVRAHRESLPALARCARRAS